MKKLPLGLFIGYLAFISAKSFKIPVSIQEMLILLVLAVLLISVYAIRHLHRVNYQKHLIAREELELRRPRLVDPEIAELERINSIEALKLKKFITEQEYSKREIARTFEKDGGLRF